MRTIRSTAMASSGGWEAAAGQGSGGIAAPRRSCVAERRGSCEAADSSRGGLMYRCIEDRSIKQAREADSSRERKEE